MMVVNFVVVVGIQWLVVVVIVVIVGVLALVVDFREFMMTSRLACVCVGGGSKLGSCDVNEIMSPPCICHIIKYIKYCPVARTICATLLYD